jgi:hypothetical protein
VRPGRPGCQCLPVWLKCDVELAPASTLAHLGARWWCRSSRSTPAPGRHAAIPPIALAAEVERSPPARCAVPRLRLGVVVLIHNPATMP